MRSGETAVLAHGFLLLCTACLLNCEPLADLSCPDICHCFVLESKVHTDCSHRELTTLPEEISSNVQVLDLSNNLFESYSPRLQEFWNLESLNLAGNQLSAPLPDYFELYPNLESLNLSHNKYSDWDNKNRQASVKFLDLSRNYINTLHASSFSGMFWLQFLDLSENRIKTLPDTMFSDSSNLETLILSRNDLDTIPKFKTSSLKKLDLSMCQISLIEADSFAEKSSLLEVDLSKNQIDSIPDFLSSNTTQSLDLSYNTIGSINGNTFRRLPHLAILRLSGNEFEEIWTPGYFSTNKYLREVHLTGNRWGCEGFGVNLLLMYDYLTRDSRRVPDASALICYTPANVTGWSWQKAYVYTWHIDDSGDSSYKYASVLAGLVVGVLLTACLCRTAMLKKIRELESQRNPRPHANNNGAAGSGAETRVTIETVDIRIPLRREAAEDLPPTYDEALLMPRLDGSFHSLPDYLGPRHSASAADARLSRSINDLLDDSAPPPAESRRSRRTISAQLAQALSQ